MEKILPIRIEGAELVWPEGRAPLTGTYRELAQLAGVEPGVAEGVYADTTGVSLDEPLSVDPAAAALVLGWFAMKALRTFAPTEEPVLWPEHFDLGIAVDRSELRHFAGRQRNRDTVCLRRSVDAPDRSVLE